MNSRDWEEFAIKATVDIDTALAANDFNAVSKHLVDAVNNLETARDILRALGFSGKEDANA